MHGPLTLSMKELDRLQVLTRIAERRLTRRRAAGLLQIGERQVRRLYRAFVQDGAAGLVSRRRGRPSARRLPAATQERALALIRERYADFGPTFAHQKLTEEHALVLSVETLRGWMSAATSMAASTLVRGSWPALHVAGLRRRRHQPPHGALLRGHRVHVRLLPRHPALPRASRQAHGVLQRPAQRLSRPGPRSRPGWRLPRGRAVRRVSARGSSAAHASGTSSSTRERGSSGGPRRKPRAARRR